LHDWFQFPTPFALYNPGPTGSQTHLISGNRLPAEPPVFVARVTEIFGETAWPDATFEHPTGSTMVRKSIAIPFRPGLFFTLSGSPVRRFPHRRAAYLCLSRPSATALIDRLWKQKTMRAGPFPDTLHYKRAYDIVLERKEIPG
jgi:hypothetical protein